jgi:hypothetical protein
MYVVRTDGSGGTELFSDGKSLDLTPSFTPGGEEVVFASNRAGRRLSIWKMAASGAPGITQLTSGDANDVWPAIDSDPRPRLFYQSMIDLRTEPRLFSAQVGSTFRTDLTTTGMQPRVSPKNDVLVFTSDVLKEPVKISGEPIANLIASTSGTDSDWVVKLIDLYPAQVAGQPDMGGYQLMISADVFRGRYRESLEFAKPITANEPLKYRFALPTANHVFLPGHRIMVQIQSSWFPLYDRNPQTFVKSIFWAKPEDYKKATQRIYNTSFIELPLVTKN